jgi:hypothetical protein
MSKYTWGNGGERCWGLFRGDVLIGEVYRGPDALWRFFPLDGESYCKGIWANLEDAEAAVIKYFLNKECPDLHPDHAQRAEFDRIVALLDEDAPNNLVLHRCEKGKLIPLFGKELRGALLEGTSKERRF